MFQFRRFPSYTYFIQCRMTGYCPAGLPHSDIPGSMDICSSPRLFAACHVLLRLLMPRHSPCALFSLTYFLVNKKGLALVLIEFELCRLQSSLKLFVLPLKSSTKICCFPLLLALHTLVTLFSFQGAVLVSLETRFKHLAILNA